MSYFAISNAFLGMVMLPLLVVTLIWVRTLLEGADYQRYFLFFVKNQGCGHYQVENIVRGNTVFVQEQKVACVASYCNAWPCTTLRKNLSYLVVKYRQILTTSSINRLEFEVVLKYLPRQNIYPTQENLGASLGNPTKLRQRQPCLWPLPKFKRSLKNGSRKVFFFFCTSFLELFPPREKN